MKSPIDYDCEEVMDYCQNTAAAPVEQLSSDLIALKKELDDCQDKFHCKGGDSANAVIKIYKGFATAIGSCSADTGTGLGGLVVGAAKIITVSYGEAAADLKIQQAENYVINV